MEIYPGEVIEFSDVKPDVLHERIMRIRNLTSRNARVRISTFPKFSYFSVKLKSLSAVAPNLYVDAVVSFRFRADEVMPSVLEDALHVRLEGGPVQAIKLLAKRG